MELEKLEKLLKKVDSQELLPTEELIVNTKEKVLEELDLIDSTRDEVLNKEVTYNKPNFRFVQFLVVTSFVLIFLLYRATSDKEIYAYVHVDINPSFEMIIDSNNIVLQTIAINDNSKELLKNLKLTNKSLDRAVEDILEKSINMDLISDKSNNVIISACLAEKYANEKKEEANLNRILDNLKTLMSTYQDSKINSHTLMVSSEIYNNARQYNISMSRYVLFKEFERRGFDYNIEDIKYKDISYIIGKLTKRSEDNTKENNKPTASFIYTPMEVTIGDIVNFDATNSYDLHGNITQYSWDFGDGTNGVGEIVDHRYTEAGNYSVKLSVTNNLGLTTTYVKRITVKLNSSNNTKIDWEDGSIEGFISDNNSSTLSNTTEKYYDGSRSLKWDITASKDEILGICKDLHTIIPSGSTVTFRIWVPLGAPIRAIQPYVMAFEGDYENFKWYSSWQRYGSLKKDAWNEFTIDLPSDMDMTLEQQIGIQCETIGEGDFSIYIDLIEW
ncbi:UNVERIFIED_CONTAM: FOG: PKD repeat [Acetivibrio alkalicellulosi]